MAKHFLFSLIWVALCHGQNIVTVYYSDPGCAEGTISRFGSAYVPDSICSRARPTCTVDGSRGIRSFCVGNPYYLPEAINYTGVRGWSGRATPGCVNWGQVFDDISGYPSAPPPTDFSCRVIQVGDIYSMTQSFLGRGQTDGSVIAISQELQTTRRPMDSTSVPASTGSTPAPSCEILPNSCDFYRTCVERKIPCGPSGYATSYGLKYCNLFLNNLEQFTPEGQTWVGNVLICLQRKILPFKGDCTSLLDFAFDSHPGCYVDNGICSVISPTKPLSSFSDVKALSRVISTDFDFSTTSKTLRQAMQVAMSCLGQYSQTIELKVKGLAVDALDSFTGSISSFLGLSSDQVVVKAVVPVNSPNKRDPEITYYMQIGLLSNTNNTASVIANALIQSIQNGTFVTNSTQITDPSTCMGDACKGDDQYIFNTQSTNPVDYSIPLSGSISLVANCLLLLLVVFV